MPPKQDVKTLAGKRDNAVQSLYELFEEFEAVFSVEPQLDTLEAIFSQVESKYRSVKKQQETILDRLVEEGVSTEDESALCNKKLGDKVKADFLQIKRKYAAYQRDQNSEKTSNSTVALEAMTAAVRKMAETLGSKPSSLERLSVPMWDGARRSYSTWKKEFNHWMMKCGQDKEEQLQRFRKALPKSSWWTEQVKTCKSIEKAWEILDIEFADKRKLMDDLLAEINNFKQVKRDSKSLTYYAVSISGYVNDMEDNGCSVLEASEAPFFMSQLLSKLDPVDNSDFGREMQRQGKEENVTNLIAWLHQESSIRSRGKRETAGDAYGRSHLRISTKRTDNHAANNETLAQETCPLGCATTHPLAACPLYQSSTVNQRWEIVKSKRRCRKCLQDHHTNDCEKLDGTSCNKCQKNHHRSLHNDRERFESPIPSLNPNAASFPSQDAPATADNNNVQGSAVQKREVQPVTGLCPVQRIKILDASGTFQEILAMLDSGSNTSLLSKNAASRLGLTGSSTHLTMNLAGGQKKSEGSEVIEIIVASPTDEDIRKTLQVYTVKKPCNAAKTVSRKSVERYPHLKKVTDKLHLSGGAIDLLIGTDFVDAFVDVHTAVGEPGEPIAKRNCFGWLILGQIEPNAPNPSGIQSVEVGTINAVEDIKNLLQQDLIGVKPTQLCTCNESTLRENRFVKSISDSTKLVNGRIQVKMPWKESGPPKRSNYDIALKRMYAAEKSFKKKDCFKVVDEEVKKLLEQDFVKQIPPNEIDHSRPEWYLPLQVIFTPERTTKVRLVFDSSSKGQDGLSLNDHLEKGPNYINSLPNVLIAWRWDEVAFTGDVKKMFNQVLVHPEDQVYHRFLWRGNEAEPPSVYQWLRLSFGDKPAPDIATNSINVLAKATQATFPEAARELQDHVYVDDICSSKPTTKDAKRIIDDIDVILGKGHFQIKAWHSNYKEVDQTDGEHFTDVLGHRWNKTEDKFSFKRDDFTGQLTGLSKRMCLRLVAQLWDPLGLVAPVTVNFRIDLQELWHMGYNWDEILPECIQQKWAENLQSLKYLLTFEFDRKLRPSNAVGAPEVHGFSDGGEKAYGAAIFLRWKLSDGTYCCIPVMVKPFVAPLKKKTIPRLELLGSLALVRLYDTCLKALKFANLQDCKRTLWVDSSTVLSWIRTPPRQFRPFVSARVAEIQETVGVENFRYIRSKTNPADALTRGTNPDCLREWLKGPPFLQLPEADWPEFEEDAQGIHRKDLATLREKKPLTTTEVASCRVAHDKLGDCPLLSHLLNTCSTFPKVRKTLAYVLRFIQNARRKKVRAGAISVQELKEAERQLFKWTQFHIDDSIIDKKFMVRTDEYGVLRAHGRLENIRTLPDDMRNPIVLPRDHQLVHLLLYYLHEKLGHCGYQSLIHEARRKFWIIGLRNMAKSLTSKCVTCRKLRKKPLDQLIGQIPSLRVATRFSAFSSTALDMFGPLQIRLNRKTLKEAQVIIFTCMTSRAVHLELVTDKTSDAFLMAFRRFACLRGHPSTCWSDCGTNFVGAQNYLREIVKSWNLPKVQSALSEDFNCDFQWQWNTPHASHQNGVVESLIKSVRQGLNSTCSNQALTEEQWRTFLSEITYMINGRPLYPSSNDIWESPPITPNDLLIGHHKSPPQPELEERTNPRYLLRSTQSRVADFWKCWLKYFSPNLLPRNKWYHTRENLAVGDVVLELDPKCKRNQWHMALVTNTYPGDDGLVRKVRIKTQNGEYDRPIHKLCLIASKQELET